MIILALDALDISMVKRYNCKSLMQLEYGQTDISEFKLARTVVLWASFLTGKNMEAEIPVKTQWEFKLKPEETFFPFFETYRAIDVPAFSLKGESHAEERRLLKAYFEDEATVEEYDEVVWRNHEEKMETVYRELERIARDVKSSVNDFILVISDHGMRPVGRYGDHSKNGFYSANMRIGLNLPKITSFYDVIRRNAQ